MEQVLASAQMHLNNLQKQFEYILLENVANELLAEFRQEQARLAWPILFSIVPLLKFVKTCGNSLSMSILFSGDGIW